MNHGGAAGAPPQGRVNSRIEKWSLRLLEGGNRRQTLVDRLMWYVSMRFREALAE
jgi:hypothetical protein